MARNYTLTQTGAEVQDDLNKIEGARIEDGTITIGGVSITPVTTETDPTVPDWAKTPTKPEYTAEEVGALPENTTLAELPTDASHRTVTDTEKATWNAKSDFSGDYRDLTHQPDLSQFVTRTVNNLLYYYRKGEVYNREEITQLLSTITTGVWQVVPELPVASEATYGMKIYLVPSSQPQSGNVKDEYITVKNGNVYSWEQIGSTAIDLSDYVTDEDLQDALEDYVSSEAFQQALAGKQDTLVSGTNIKTVNGENILGSGNIVAGDPNAVKYTEQTLTDAQKTQARTNIGAGTVNSYEVQNVSPADQYVSTELRSLLAVAPKMVVRKISVFDAETSETSYTSNIYVSHPLMNYSGAEVVLMSYAKRNKHRITSDSEDGEDVTTKSKKGFCIATMIEDVDGDPSMINEYFTFSPVTPEQELFDFLEQNTFGAGQGTPFVARSRRYGIALRIPNPQYDGPASWNKNNTYRGVPESLYSDILEVYIGCNFERDDDTYEVIRWYWGIGIK